MAEVTSEAIRNVALVGHAGSGKTTLAEALLYKAGATARQGSVDEGTSILDYDDEERDRKFTIHNTIAHCTWKDCLVNLIDTPGYPDFVGDAMTPLWAVETAAVVIGATSGIGVNTRRLYRLAEERGLARLIVITKLDGDNIDFEGLVDLIREQFGACCRPLTLPVGVGPAFQGVVNVLNPPEAVPDGVVGDVAAAREALVETIVETDEALMERYLEGEPLDEAGLSQAFMAAVASGAVVPVVCAAGRSGLGAEAVLDALASVTPSPARGVKRSAKRVGKGQADAEPAPLAADPGQPFVAQVFKVLTDPFVGKLSYLRVFQGSLPGESTSLTNVRTGKTSRVAQVFAPMGKEQSPLGRTAVPGDIVAVAKVDDLAIGDTVTAGGPAVQMPPITALRPMVSLAVQPKSRGDEAKIGGALARLADEDLTFKMARDQQTREMVVTGVSTLHLDLMLGRLKKQFGVEVETRPPKIPYLETITKSAKYVEYTHKKQTGGAGQYARVMIDLEPLPRGGGYEFVDEIVGGVIDQPFRPSVDKGIQAKMAEGVIAGYPVVDVCVRLVDGKTHPVDSKDIAFQIAGRQAFKKAFLECAPVLLEPIVNVEITAPARAMGDITGDLTSRRGRIQGMDQMGNDQVVRAQVPLAEMLTYSSQLRSMTGGEGSFVMEFSHYDVVPAVIQQQIVAAHAKAAGEEE